MPCAIVSISITNQNGYSMSQAEISQLAAALMGATIAIIVAALLKHTAADKDY